MYTLTLTVEEEEGKSLATYLLYLQQSSYSREQVLAQSRVRSGQVRVVARFDEGSEERSDGFCQGVVETWRVAEEESCET